MEKRITSPLTADKVRDLRAGDSVLLSGVIYTARDAAHKRLCRLLESGKELPFDPMDQIVYYVGPTPEKPGQPIGSAGPTTSYRMDAYAPALMRAGLRGMIGKGKRSDEVRETMKECTGVYFGAIGGAGAVIARSVKKAEIIAYEDLGAEAVRRLEVEDMPLFVIMDCYGGNLYETGREGYLAKFGK